MANTLDLIPPDGYILDEFVVAAIQESIPQCGLRQPIVVVGRHILHGVHRWEAAKRLGLHHVEVVEDAQVKTPAEYEAQVLVENLCRRHLSTTETDTMRARLVELWMPQIAQEMQSAPKSPIGTRDVAKPIGRGNPPQKQPTPRGETIRKVANTTGATEKAVQRSVERTSANTAGRLSKTVERGRVSDLDEYQNPIPENLLDKWETTRSCHKAIDRLLRDAQAQCSKLVKIGGEVSSYSQHWKELLHQVAYEARSKYPYALCLECDGQGCRLCRKIGFVSDAVLTHTEYKKRIGQE